LEDVESGFSFVNHLYGTYFFPHKQVRVVICTVPRFPAFMDQWVVEHKMRDQENKQTASVHATLAFALDIGTSSIPKCLLFFIIKIN
jgi:hypothetical protein